jgi:hypothetical protein
VGVAGHWRRQHDEELHNFYASPNVYLCDQIEREMDGTRSTHGRDEKCQQYFI